MTFLKKLSRFGSTKVRAVYDEDLIKILKKSGLFEKIESGSARCKYTNEIITLDNLEGIIPTSDGYELVSTTALRTSLVYGH